MVVPRKMASKTLHKILSSSKLLTCLSPKLFGMRPLVSKPSGALLQEPTQVSMGVIRVIITVIPGLLIGATISKTIANFLEENDLFVPSEDDDDDD